MARFLIFIFLGIVACQSPIPFHKTIDIETETPNRFFEAVSKYMVSKQICVITNQAGIGRLLLVPAIEKRKFPTRLHEMLAYYDASLVKIFTPEHGLSAQEEESGNQHKLKFPVIGTYKLKVPDLTREFESCQEIVFDLPDAGIRPFTYRTIMTRSMRAFEKGNFKRKRFWILDVPNPASYLKAQGPITQKKYFSILGEQEIPFFPYYTYGELALKYYYRHKMK
ncbi:MAG: DUF1343 domain-containing protein, partial [Candidatus Hydrogenedentota bacterium]